MQNIYNVLANRICRRIVIQQHLQMKNESYVYGIILHYCCKKKKIIIGGYCVCESHTCVIVFDESEINSIYRYTNLLCNVDLAIQLHVFVLLAFAIFLLDLLLYGLGKVIILKRS